MKYYEGFKDEMILRDYLAYDRTRLALTRTVLAFVRTALGLLATGLGLIILQEAIALELLGYGILLIAVAVLAFGYSYWRKYRERLDSLEENKTEGTSNH